MSDNKPLRIQRFPMHEMKDYKNILLIGKRGTGKSTLLKHILYEIRKRVNFGIGMSPTLDTIMMFEDCMPSSHIYDQYNLNAVTNLIATLKALKEQGRPRTACLALDDCMYAKGIMKSEEMREIHMNGRHFHLWFINSVQYLMDLGPDLRNQIDYVFVLREPIRANREKLHKYFFGIFPTYEEFSLVMDKTTENHECLVLDATQKTNNIEDCIFYFKANPNIQKFMLGNEIYFKLNHMFQKKKSHSERHHQQKLKLPDPVVKKKKIVQVEKSEHDMCK